MSPRTPLLDPSSYFDRSDRPSLGVAAGIVTANAVATTALVWWFVDRVVGTLDISRSTRSEVMSELGGQFVGLFVATFVGWVLIAGLIHVFVWFADGQRGFGTTLAVVGEAMVVSLVMLPLLAFGFDQLLGRLPSDPQALREFFERVSGSGSGVLFVVTLVRALWEAGVQAVGLAAEHDVSLGKMALVTVGIGLVSALL